MNRDDWRTVVIVIGGLIGLAMVLLVVLAVAATCNPSVDTAISDFESQLEESDAKTDAKFKEVLGLKPLEPTAAIEDGDWDPEAPSMATALADPHFDRKAIINLADEEAREQTNINTILDKEVMQGIVSAVEEDWSGTDDWRISNKDFQQVCAFIYDGEEWNLEEYKQHIIKMHLRNVTLLGAIVGSTGGQMQAIVVLCNKYD